MSSANFLVWSHKLVNNFGFWNTFYFYFFCCITWCRHKNGFEIFINSKDVNNENCATCIIITHLIVSLYHTLSQILFMQQMFMYLYLCNGSNEIKLCIIFLSPCFVRFDTFYRFICFASLLTQCQKCIDSHMKNAGHNF